MKKKLENNIEFTINLLSLISMLLGIIISIVLVSKIYCGEQTHIISEIELKLVFILLSAGLLGTTLNFILKKLVKEYIYEYIDNDKLKEIQIQIEEEKKTLELEEEEQSSIDDSDLSESNLDTIIVPVNTTLNEIKINKKYRCNSESKLKEGIKYIAFYYKKEIVGYGKIKGEPLRAENKDWLYEIDSFITKQIIHNGKYAFVQNKMYCNINKLRKASNTSEIRPNNNF